MLGPAFVAAVAYVDPGNFATNLQAGAKFGYALLWVVLAANLMAMLVQYLSAKLGIATDHNLPELCRERFPRWATVGLWIQAEIMAMSTDVAEFLGAAIALNLLFGVPPLVAGLLTGVIAFGILELQRHGYRRFEVAIAALLGIVFAGFLYETMHIGPSAHLALGGLIPSLHNGDAVYLAVGIIGATVMPHVIYLHSALTNGRVAARSDGERRRVLRFQRIDVIVALGAAGLINLAMMAVFAKLFHTPELSGITSLQVAHEQIGNLVGGWRGAGVRGGAAGLGGLVVERRDLRRPGGDVRVHRHPHPAVHPPRGDDDSGARGPRAQRQPDRRTRAQPGGAVLRHPVRAVSAGVAHQPARRDGRARQRAADDGRGLRGGDPDQRAQRIRALRAVPRLTSVRALTPVRLGARCRSPRTSTR